MKFNRAFFFIFKWLVAPIYRLLYRQKVSGLENLPKTGPYILTPNHSYKFDPFILETFTIFHINRKLYYLAKPHPLWSFFGRKASKYGFGVIVYHRKTTKQEAFKEAFDLLRSNDILVIFPEGEARTCPELQKGKTGAVRLAIWLQIPIIPVGIISSRKMLPPKKRKYYHGKEIRFGPPIRYTQPKNQPLTRELLHQFTDDLMKRIAKLSGQRYNIKR